ncbi:MAG: hypothetical protein A2026_01070 [Deltaproteobacteria bacterium RBG_19FT_COMBO_46_12]|nr:MAG: hypothetical protein A2026_01070 [Deltaproteobacteria bacterium RBG_19FT_COMBO_46_12]
MALPVTNKIQKKVKSVRNFMISPISINSQVFQGRGAIEIIYINMHSIVINFTGFEYMEGSFVCQ